MTLIRTKRPQTEQDELTRWLSIKADERTEPQCTMLHAIANMIRPRLPKEILQAERKRADNGDQIDEYRHTFDSI